VAVGDTVGHELSCRGGWIVFGAVTQIATLRVFRYVAAHPWPPEVASDQVRGFPLARMTCDWRIVEGVYKIMSELAIRGDIYSSSVEY